ncbi:MAG: glycerophosphodiester phosphodiesterase [Sporichthyaceae bacterium]
MCRSTAGRQAADMVLAIAHRAPADPERCAELAEIGAEVFEIDVQAHAEHLVSSHYLPLHPRVPLVRRDRRSFTVRRRVAAEIDLARAVAAVPARSAILFDLKCDVGRAALDLVELLAAADPDRGRCVVSTKGWHTLDALRAHGFRTWRTVADARALASVLAGPPLADAAVTVRHTLLTPEVVDRLRERVAAVMCWTVNDVDRARRLVDAGVDGVTSDAAEVLATVAAT